jgi:hypothetical protein
MGKYLHVAEPSRVQALFFHDKMQKPFHFIEKAEF